jgi:predicted YcjX-like family ATPase
MRQIDRLFLHTVDGPGEWMLDHLSASLAIFPHEAAGAFAPEVVVWDRR